MKVIPVVRYTSSSLASLLLLLIAIGTHKSKGLTRNCTESLYLTKLTKIPLDRNSQQTTCRSHFEQFKFLYSSGLLNNITSTLALFHTLCNQIGCYQVISDLIQLCYSELKIPFVLACSSYRNIPCWSVPSFEKGENGGKLCSASQSRQNCSMECKDELARLKETIGCCFNNVFNTSLFGMSLYNLGIADNGLWNSCGLSTLTYCPLTRTFLSIEYQSQNSIQTFTLSAFPILVLFIFFIINL